MVIIIVQSLYNLNKQTIVVPDNILSKRRSVKSYEHIRQCIDQHNSVLWRLQLFMVIVCLL